MTRLPLQRRRYFFFVGFTAAMFMVTGCGGSEFDDETPYDIAAFNAASGDLNVVFHPARDFGVKQIRVNGRNLLTGCGFGLIGSVTGADNEDNITSCRQNLRGAMRPFNGSDTPHLPFSLQFRLDEKDPTKLHFAAHLGPSPHRFATVSMPMDAQRSLTHFRHNGSRYVTGLEQARVHSSMGAYADNRFSYAHHRGPIRIAQAEGLPRRGNVWGEIIDRQYTIRVVVQTKSRPMALFFVDHPDTRNVEFSFGPLAKGEQASVTGFIKVRRTNPAIWNRPVPEHIFEAEQHLHHQIGRRDSDGWSVHVGDTPRRFMCYGPYTRAIPEGNRSAFYRLLLDNTTADNLQILTLDVYDAAANRVLAQRTIRRRQFVNGPFRYHDFQLDFVSRAGQLLEFRTFWHGSSYVRQDHVRVR